MWRNLWLRKREGVISLGVLLLIVMLGMLLLTSPLINQAQRYRVELRKDARILQELRAIDQVKDELQQILEQYQQQNLQTWIYTETQANKVSLDIQRIVSDLLAKTGAEVRSISVARNAVADGYAQAGVEVNFIADMAALMDILLALESNRPLLVLDNLRVDPFDYRRSNNETMPQRVSASVTVFSYLTPGSDEQEPAL